MVYNSLYGDYGSISSKPAMSRKLGKTTPHWPPPPNMDHMRAPYGSISMRPAFSPAMPKKVPQYGQPANADYLAGRTQFFQQGYPAPQTKAGYPAADDFFSREPIDSESVYREAIAPLYRTPMQGGTYDPQNLYGTQRRRPIGVPQVDIGQEGDYMNGPGLVRATREAGLRPGQLAPTERGYTVNPAAVSYGSPIDPDAGQAYVKNEIPGFQMPTHLTQLNTVGGDDPFVSPHNVRQQVSLSPAQQMQIAMTRAARGKRLDDTSIDMLRNRFGNDMSVDELRNASMSPQDIARQAQKQASQDLVRSRGIERGEARHAARMFRDMTKPRNIGRLATGDMFSGQSMPEEYAGLWQNVQNDMKFRNSILNQMGGMDASDPVKLGIMFGALGVDHPAAAMSSIAQLREEENRKSAMDYANDPYNQMRSKIIQGEGSPQDIQGQLDDLDRRYGKGRYSRGRPGANQRNVPQNVQMSNNPEDYGEDPVLSKTLQPHDARQVGRLRSSPQKVVDYLQGVMNPDGSRAYPDDKIDQALNDMYRPWFVPRSTKSPSGWRNTFGIAGDAMSSMFSPYASMFRGVNPNIAPQILKFGSR